MTLLVVLGKRGRSALEMILLVSLAARLQLALHGDVMDAEYLFQAPAHFGKDSAFGVHLPAA